MLPCKSVLLLLAGLALFPGGCGHRQKAKPQLGEVERWPRPGDGPSRERCATSP